MPTKSNLEAIAWYQEDARSEYHWASVYRDTPGKGWIAARVQAAAAASAKQARLLLGIE